MVERSPPGALFPHHRRHSHLLGRGCHHDLYPKCRGEILQHIPALRWPLCGLKHPDSLGDYSGSKAAYEESGPDRHCKLRQLRRSSGSTFLSLSKNCANAFQRFHTGLRHTSF